MTWFGNDLKLHSFARPNGTVLSLEVEGMVPTLTSAVWEVSGVVEPVLDRSEIGPSPIRVGFHRREASDQRRGKALVGGELVAEEFHVDPSEFCSDGENDEAVVGKEELMCDGDKESVSSSRKRQIRNEI